MYVWWRGAHRVLMGKSERIGPPVSPRNTFEDNIKMYLKDIAWDGMDYFRIARVGDNAAGCCLNGNEHYGFRKMRVCF